MPRTAQTNGFPAILVLVAVALVPSGYAETAARRPRIGLALGGGGARGGAHVGVLEVLEELHVPVDVIAATSMGAVVGGIYAAGVPIDRIDHAMRDADWSDLLDDRPAYRDLVFRRKEDASRYLVDFELGIHKGHFRQPHGLRAGQKLAFEARALLLDTPPQTDFSKLATPFRAVATDVETGERVVLDHGDLVESILASFAVPGVFAPIEIDGRLLIDGGITDNLPVDLVREAGADVVIAVDVGALLVKRDKLKSMFSVLGQTMSFLTHNNSDASARTADVLIAPDLTGISSAAFGETSEAIARGRDAALALRETLAKFALDEAGWEAYVATRSVPKPPPRRIDHVRVEGNHHVDARLILGHMEVKAGDVLDVAALRKDLVRVFGLDYFERVTLDITGGPDGNTLVVKVAEKDWGPTYVRFGLETVDDLQGDARYAVRASFTRTLINRLGLESRTDFQLGSTLIARTELYQPLDFSGWFFLSPWIQGQREQQPFYDLGRRLAEYDVRVAGFGLDLGVQFGSVGEIRVGVARTNLRADVDTGAASLPSFDVDQGAIVFRLAFSTLDRPAIPTRGCETRAGVDLQRAALGADDEYDRAFGGASCFFSRGRSTGMFVVDGGTNLGSTIPSYDEFTLGGLFSLGGYAEGEFRGQYFATAKVGYYYRFAALPPGFGQGVYVGGLIEGGNAWATTAAISASDLHYGFTAILGADTIIGPAFFAVAVGEGGSTRLYLTVGRTF
jgi:NTE family protein